MSSFKVGQEVIFSKGNLKDVRGVVVVPHYQISQSDWPEVLIRHGDDIAYVQVYVPIDKVRPAEDPYEYGATWLDSAAESSYWDVFESEWGTLEETQEQAQHATELGNRGVKIMRRLKAGEPEDYNV